MARIDNPLLAQTVGRAIAKQRVIKGLTQERVAEHLGIGVEAVSRIERGVVLPTVVRLVELAEIFQCNAADLLTGASARASDQASYLAQLLEPLDGRDRALLIDTIDRLAMRLRQS